MTKTSDAESAVREVPLQNGGRACLIEADAEFATIQVSTPFPPGSTLVLLVSGAPLALKVRSCRKLSASDGSIYRVNARFVSLSREQRLALGVEPP